MAGPRANLAVTKDGETYNKLQRPHDFLNDVAACDQTNERKRERAAVGSSVAEPGIGNKRAKIQHATLTAAISRPNDDERQYRGAGPVSECGMRMTLPIDEEDLHSDDSLGEALAYLRSVRSEASSIPHLLVASKTNTNDVDNTSQQRAAPTTPHAVYQDGAWISVDESYDATYNDNHAQDNLDPQDIYHKRLMKRFEALRSTLSAYGLHRSTPARRSIDGANRSTSGPPPSNRHEWLYTIDREFPTETQISQLDQKSVRRGLEYCVHAMDRFDTISSQKSCWIWTLLAMSGDIGTLDSQKMSHIRDLGNKAGQLSSRLHRGPELQSRVIEKDQLHASPATNGAEDVHEASESAVRKDSSDEHDPAQGFVRSDGNERPISTTAITLGTTPLKTPHDLQSPDATSGISDVSTDLGRDTDTDMNNDTLERARARLLAQLGDNLVQAGIPASSQSPVGADQPDENQDDSQSKVKVRTIPSRAEAERQRQLMRTQYSAAQGSRGVRVLEPNTTATGSSCEDHSSSLVDLNTRVTIDMILTVVGECYGQRDLLKFRKAW